MTDATWPDWHRLRQKLANPNFSGKAPADVVARERQKEAEAEAALATLREQLAKFADG